MQSCDSAQIETFLARYADADSAEQFAPLYEDQVLVGDPDGNQHISREQLLAGIAARSELFAAIGYGGTTLASHSATWLGEHYCLTSTTWSIPLRPRSSDPVTLTMASDFLLRRRGDELRIAAYLTRTSILDELRRVGVLPAAGGTP
ncbi:hypothetical protein [Rhodococcus oryzae]|uniref:hypothetical protein n=1 Tax=Rhodococcus oryzae TaxID=2571143 RepID=UPI0037963500